MSKKIPRAGGESTEVSDELYMAHHVHTLAHLLAQHLAGGWAAPRPFAGPTAESFPMAGMPWAAPTWHGLGAAAPVAAAPMGASMGVPMAAPMAAPMLVAVPPQSLVYWYP